MLLAGIYLILTRVMLKRKLFTRSSVACFALLLVVSLFMSTITAVRVSAADDTDNAVTVDIGAINDKVEAQYRARVAMRVVFDDPDNCFISRSKIGKEWKSTFNENDSDNGDRFHGPWYATHEVGRIGSLFKNGKVADGKDHEIDCNTKQDMQPVFEALGYDGNGDFISAVYDCNVPGSGCNLRKNPRDIVLNHVKKNLLDGQGGNLRGDFTDPIRYWYWNKIYRHSACKGILSDKSSDFNKPDENHAKDINPDNKFHVEDDGTITANRYIITNGVALDHAVEGLAATAKADLGKETTCLNIAKALTGTVAGAYVRDFIIPGLHDAAPPEIAAKCGTDSEHVNTVVKCYSENNVTPIGTLDPVGAVNENDQDSCEAKGGGLSWFMCPLINIIGSALNWIDTQISRLLEVDYDKINTPEMYNAWAGFRNLGLTLLIAMMMVMVISTAIGTGLFEAYTVKRAMPRMVAAIIFMSLSWYASLFLIDFFNVIGRGTLGIMTSPFGTKAQTLTGLFDPSLGGFLIQGGVVTFATIGTGALVWAGGIGIIATYFAGALLTMLVAFLVLIARQMFIVVAILFSPLAILSWVFPNNNKLWKFWWESFSKLLIMYPMVMALIAAGRIFAASLSDTTSSGAEGGLLNPLLKLTAYVLPYVFIPLTFKAAGGIFGNLVGMANDRSKGAFDRLKKSRVKTMGDIKSRAAAGDLLPSRTIGRRTFGGNTNRRGNPSLVGRLNRRASGLSMGMKGHYGFGQRGEAFHDIHGREAMQEEIRNNHMLQQLAFDDPGIAVMALSGGTTEGARRAAEDLIAAGVLSRDQANRALNSAMAVGITKNAAGAAMTLMAQNKSRVLSGALAGAAGMALVRQSATELSEGNDQMVENLMGGFAFHSRNAGRLDLGGEFEGQTWVDGWNRSSVAQQAQSFGASLQSFSDQILADVHSADPNARRAAVVALMEMQSMLPNATGENQAIINETLRRAGVDHGPVNVAQTDANGVPQRDSAGNIIYREVPPLSTEEQLAYISGGSITGAEIRGLARTYDAQTPYGARGEDGQPQQPQQPQSQSN